MAIPSFIFGGDAKAKTPQELAQQRAIIHALMSSQRAPKNVGEGLNALGDGIVASVLGHRADAAEKAGQESAAEAFNPIVGSLAGFPAAPSANGGSAGDSASADPSGYRDAIASIESAGSGDYGAVGPTNPKLGRALGRYQVMEANIGPWSKEALGREVTPQEFLENPKIQDAIFDHKFGSYVQKYGNPQDAASAWFTGQPLSVGANRRDVLGTSGNQYVDKFTRALGGQSHAQAAPQQVASLDPSVGMVTPDANSQFTPQADQPVASDPKTQRILGTMMNPQPMGGAPQQMAQAAPQGGPDLDKLSVMAGGNAGALPSGAQQSGPSMAQLLAAGGNQWLNPNQSAIVKALLGQKLKEQDPARALDMEYKRAQIAKLTDPNARDKFGNSVIWGQNADGDWVAMQPSSGGGLVPAQTPDGIKLSPPGIGQVNLGTSYAFRDRNGKVVNEAPIDNAGKAAAAASGKAQGEAAFDLPRVEQNAQQTLDVLERMKTHPGRAGSTGFIEGMLPSRTSDQVDFQSLADQTQGQSFLQAFQMLKGAGQITDIEGRKATEAISRLGNQRLSDDDYLRAISDLEDVVRTGLARARKQAGQGASSDSGGSPQSGGVVDYRDYFGGH